MGPQSGQDIIYAGAGLLWGIVTTARGYKMWREEHRHAYAAHVTSNFLITMKSSVSQSIAMGTVTALVCGVYLVLQIVGS